MSSTTTEINVSFTMKDGRNFVCACFQNLTHGNYCGLPENCYSDECDVSEPTYSIDGEEIDYGDLSDEMQTIADEMYEADFFSEKFTLTENDC